MTRGVGVLPPERETRGRRILLGWLGLLWILLVSAHWGQPASGPGYDPTGRWMERMEHWPPWAFGLVSAGLLAAPLAAIRLRRQWPQSRPQQVCPAQQAALAYLVMSLGSNLWMLLGLSLSQLGQQYFYALWVGLCLWPQRRWLSERPAKAWWRWGLTAFGLALLGAILYGFLLSPEPSSNRAVLPLLQSQAGERGLWLLLLCVLTPWLEESWYRGLLSGPQKIRLVVSALVFAVVHADPAATPVLFWLGLVFAWARWGGGLPAAVLAHALWNVTVAVFLLV